MDFMADMQMAMLRALGVSSFNLIVTDYSFWSTLAMLEFVDSATSEVGISRMMDVLLDVLLNDHACTSSCIILIFH
jgi:hypothetical protein